MDKDFSHSSQELATEPITDVQAWGSIDEAMADENENLNDYDSDSSRSSISSDSINVVESKNKNKNKKVDSGIIENKTIHNNIVENKDIEESNEDGLEFLKQAEELQKIKEEDIDPEEKRKKIRKFLNDIINQESLKNSTINLNKMFRLYNEASSLYIHRRFFDALDIINYIFLIINSKDINVNFNSDLLGKIWHIYLSVLDNIITSPGDNGESYKHIPTRYYNLIIQISAEIQSGSIWDQLVSTYNGSIGDVDIGVMSCLILLLVKHTINFMDTKIRLEKYLNALSLESITATEESLKEYQSLLELYILRVLPNVKDWEYAKNFAQTNEFLGEQKRRKIISILENMREEANNIKHKNHINTFRDDVNANCKSDLEHISNESFINFDGKSRHLIQNSNQDKKNKKNKKRKLKNKNKINDNKITEFNSYFNRISLRCSNFISAWRFKNTFKLFFYILLIMAITKQRVRTFIVNSLYTLIGMGASAR